MTIFIVLDFDKISQALDNLLSFINKIKQILKENIDKDILKSILREKQKEYKSKQNNIDDIVPISAYVIGNKYDILEKISAEKLKWICKTLRYYSFINGLNLIFHSNNNMKLINILISTVTYFSFGQSQLENINRYVQKNETRALYLKYYNDNLQEIGDPKIMQSKGDDMNSLWLKSYNTMFVEN